MYMSLNKKLFLIIWLAGTLSILAVLPYAFYLQQDILQSVPFSLPILVLLSLLQNSVLIAIAASSGLFFAKKVGFTFPVLEQVLLRGGNAIKWKSFLRLPIVLGIVIGIVIVFGDYLFKLAGVVIDAKYVTEIPLWKSFLAAFYGGIAEETLLRLFLVSMLVWVFGKITRSETPLSRSGLVWSAITIATILFGLGHLPTTSAITELTPLVIARAVVLNGIAGLVFGWLYWKKGFEAAVIAHFSADIINLIIFPILLRFI
jgi:Type II CAAX prenyl endopeptidase Rce1-like